MLELYGKGYVIDHCASVYLERREERLYRIYVTDALKAIAENTTHYLGADDMFDYGASLSLRWIEALEPQQEEEIIDDRSCEEVAHSIWERIRNGR